MSDYLRSTRECTFDQLRPELRRAIVEYAQKQSMDNFASEIIQCCETKSEKKADGLFAWLDGPSDQTIYTGALFTAEWLVWARSGDVSGILVSAAWLKDIRVRDFASLFVRDQGLEIYGYISNAKGMVRGYIGMGPEPATQSFCDGVREAIKKISPPKKKFPAWMGG
jgi:hypothetical protein